MNLIEEIFGEAAALPPAARAAYLNEACAGQLPEVRARVETLLRSHDLSGFMEKSPVRRPPPAPEWETVELNRDKKGARIGPYLLLEQIGEGGFGTVWLADQERPIQRRVALKIIKPGMDTKEVIARFEQERRALALMDHPNIAKVLDAGSTPWGRAYFVMELVRGIRLTDYCDQAKLPTKERLSLFILVCHAVQHAHQKGIIHRDLKPSNILVTLQDGVPVPKVIDFGVAKATQEPLTDLSVYTQYDQMIGTPLYMSPEQAEMSGIDIDTRSDIYSLGVLLYELLTGRTPFDPEALMRQGLDEIRRVIREQDPPKPSTAIHTLPSDKQTLAAGHRQSEISKLANLLRGDLDWIVMKALEKDRSRRYATANSLAEDIRNHLTDEPILARAPGGFYRLHKFLHRKRAILLTLAVAFGTLLLGFGVSYGVSARRERIRAQAAAFAARSREFTGKKTPDMASQEREWRVNPEAALKEIDKALILLPENAEYILFKADILEALFRFREAANSYREALHAAPDQGGNRAKVHLALCSRLAGDSPQESPIWYSALVELYLVLRDEKRLDDAPLIRETVIDYTKRRIGLLDLPSGDSGHGRISRAKDGFLELDLTATDVRNLNPLLGLPLDLIDLEGLQVTDISPLQDLPLRNLNIARSKVVDLSPLAGIRELSSLTMYSTKAADLTPLRSLPIEWFDLRNTPVGDLGPLRGKELRVIRISGTQVSDLAPLEGMPIVELGCGRIPALDFSPLAGCPLRTASFPHTSLATLEWMRGQPSGANLRGLDVSYSKIRDLSPLSGSMHLFSLSCSHTGIGDVEALRGLPLVELDISSTSVTTLAPLAGMPLLQTLRFQDSLIEDVAPLLKCQSLANLVLSRRVRTPGTLRALPHLRWISYGDEPADKPALTAAAFWAELDRAAAAPYSK